MTCTGVACRRAAGPASALVTGPFGYWVIGLGGRQRTEKRSKQTSRKVDIDADIRQRAICLDNNAVLLGKLEKLNVFRVVVWVEAYLRANTTKRVGD